MKNKNFWKLCKLFFTEKGSQYDQNITLIETKRSIFEKLSVNQNKSTSGTIPTKVLRSLAKEICIPVTDFINSAILNGKFPSELKMADVIPIFKKTILLKKQIIGPSVYFLHYQRSTRNSFTNS